MLVRVVLEAVFHRDADGNVVTASGFHAGFFRRYLSVFDAVEVVARVHDAEPAPAGARAVTDPGIQVRALPFYRGVGGYLGRRRAVVTAMREAIAGDGALILRVPSPLAGCVAGPLKRSRRPYAVEVLGDPWDVFAPGAMRHPLRPFLRWHFHRQLQRQCAQATLGCYVTSQALQRRYPVGAGAVSIAASDVDLPDDAFVAHGRTLASPPAVPRLIMVGTLAQLYKAPDVLLRAVALCHQRGFPVQVDMVGDGAYRAELTQLALRLGISEHVRFLGHILSGPAVRALLDQADAFVLPSRQEGLPRAMVEAMARALPCLGSTIGGIPELLDPSALVPVGNHQALAQAIETRLRDAAWMNDASARNLERARAYHETILTARRTAFYQAVRDATASWPRGR